jgi:WD40 repeat protein
MNHSKGKQTIQDRAIQTEKVFEYSLPTAVLGLDCSRDGRLIYAACLDGTVLEVSSETGKMREIGRHNSYASGVLTTDQGVVISSGYDGELHWYDSSEGVLIRKVKAHRFWSWKTAMTTDQKWIASVTGQYRCGGYRYEPAPETEPSVKVFDVATGSLQVELSMTPPVLSVAFSPDNRYVAAGNLMGDVRVWDIHSGDLKNEWNTPDFTCWGITKSHHYVGGIFDLAFTPDGERLTLCGMGPMRDPMAGNGKQTWQQFAWREQPAGKVAEIGDSDSGKGPMESLSFHSNRAFFLMAGRMAQGNWNVAFFDSESGTLLHSLDTKMRVTKGLFSEPRGQVLLAGAKGQKKTDKGDWPEFGRILAYSILQV